MLQRERQGQGRSGDAWPALRERVRRFALGAVSALAFPMTSLSVGAHPVCMTHVLDCGAHDTKQEGGMDVTCLHNSLLLAHLLWSRQSF